MDELEAYLKTKPADDDDDLKSYLAEQDKEKAARVSRSMAAGQTQPKAGFFDRLSGAAEQALHKTSDVLEDGLQKAGSFMEGVNRKASMGAFPALVDVAGGRESREALRAANPKLNAAGEGTGAGISAVAGPGALISRGVTSAIPALASTAGKSAAARIASNMAAGGITGGVEEVANSSGEGTLMDEDALGRVGKSAGLGALFSGAVGEAAHGIGKAAGWVSGKLRDKRGQTGKLIDTMERTAPYRATEEFDQLDHGMPGVGQQVTRQGEALGELQTKTYANLNKEWAAGHDAIKNKGEPIDVGAIHKAYNKLVKKFSNKRIANPEVAAEVATGKANLSRPVEVPGAKVEGATYTPPGVADEADAGTALAKTGTKSRLIEGTTYTPPAGKAAAKGVTTPVDATKLETKLKPIATLDDLILEKHRIKDLAEFGMPKTKENYPYRTMYKSLVKAIGTVSPEMAAIDRKFMQGAKHLSEGNQIVFGKDTANVLTDTVAAKRKAAGELVQGLRDTQAGGMRMDDLEKLRTLGPEYAEIVDKAMAKIAHEATRFGKTNVVPHSGNWIMGPVLQNLAAVNTRVLDPAARATARGAKKVATGGGASRAVPLLNALSRGAQAKRERE